MISHEQSQTWMASQRIAGAAFALNEAVRIVSGRFAGVAGSVVALTGLEPEPEYHVETSSGEDLHVAQSQMLGYSDADDATALARLQRWYAARCDGDWEHSSGIRIETLDNPGWSLTVDLAGTPLVDAPLSTTAATERTGDWHDCRVVDGRFQGACSPHMLMTIVKVFIDWAEQYRTLPSGATGTRREPSPAQQGAAAGEGRRF